MSLELPSGVLTVGPERLVHRGPDHQGCFVSRQILSAPHAYASSILAAATNLSSARIRMSWSCSTVRVFNHREIRVELEAEGFRFPYPVRHRRLFCTLSSDGGARASRAFRGMFAIAVWVQSEQRLILARDGMGIKPLYYCLQDGEIYFGSELKCIFRAP